MIEFRGVTFGYGAEPVVRDVDLSIALREFICLVGPNGGGKSTLLKLMLGLLTPQRGSVRLLGGPPTHTRRRVGYMPQYVQLDPQFPVTVIDVALMGRLRPLALGPYRAADRAAALEALAEVDLADLARRPFAALSGGQRQRVLIARALACQPEVLLMDEPTASLDIGVEEQLYELLVRLNQRLTVVIVSHDVGFVSRYVGRVACVNRTVLTHDTAALTGERISELYGHGVRAVRHDHSHGHAHGHAHGHSHDHSHGGHPPPAGR